MPIEIIQSDSPFVKAILEALAQQVQHRELNKQLVNAVLTHPGNIASVCNTAFWVSMKQEEGRPIRGTLALTTPDDFTYPLEFEKPESPTFETLASLLTAAPDAVLGIHQGASGKLEIWGMGDKPNRPSCFISILRPGTLTVTIAGPLGLSYVPAIIDKGELIIPKDASAQRFRKILVETFKAQHFSEADRRRYAAQLLELVHAMCIHKHGGTLVIVPNTFRGQHIKFRYQLGKRSGNTLKSMFQLATDTASRAEQTLDTDPAHSARRLEAENALIEARKALTRIGHLTAIDGALIIGEDLTVHAFAAKLDPPQDQHFEILVYDLLNESEQSVQLSEFGGTRHQSAARFVFTHHDSTAFVASQDGSLTFLGWDHGKKQIVIALRHLEFFGAYL